MGHSKQWWLWLVVTAQRQKVFLCFILYPHYLNIGRANKSHRRDDLLLVIFWSILFHFLCGPSQQEECSISSWSRGVGKVPTGLFVPLRTRRAMGGESEYADINYLSECGVWLENITDYKDELSFKIFTYLCPSSTIIKTSLTHKHKELRKKLKKILLWCSE